MNKNNDFAGRADYLIGFGLATALSPMLIQFLGTNLPESTRTKVWVIGFSILIVGIVIDFIFKRSKKSEAAKKSS